MNSNRTFTLGIPNGSLFDATMELFKRIGIKILFNGRNFDGEIEGIKMIDRVFLMRPQDIPSAIHEGIIDCGICGWDCVVESFLKNDLIRIAELNYSKKSAKPVDVVVFSKKFSKLEDNENVTVTTEYPNITEEFFPKASKSGNVHFSYGTTESKVVSEMYDFGVCVTESGKSIRDNGLNVVQTLLVAPVVFVSKYRTSELEMLGKMLTGALYAKKFQLVSMNVVDEKAKERIVLILPALRSPTINSLGNGEFSISTVVDISILADLLVDLVLLGATDIIGTDINFAIK